MLAPEAVRPRSRVAGAVPAALAAASLAGVVGAVQPFALVGLAVLVCAGAVLVVLPRQALPSVALGLYALVPLHYLPIPETAATTSPSLLVAVVWMVRLWREEPERRADREGRLLLALSVLTLGLLLVTSLAGAYLKTGLGWSLAFVVNVLLVAVAVRVEHPRARELLVATWSALAAGLGLYAVVEALVLHANPVFKLTQAAGGRGVEQVWAVYRATTTLGHPLENAAFFVLGATLALATAVRTGSRAYGAAAVCAIAGLAATGSRGPTAALLVGVGWVLVAQAGRVPRIRIAALGAVLLLALSGAVVVQLGRSGSAEADSSSQYRAFTVAQGVESVRDNPWLGVGAGASAVAKQAEGGSLATLSYENGWLEAAVSDGLPFLALLLGVFGYALWTAARRAHVEAGAALAVAMIVMANSNVLEGSRQGLIRFGFLLGLAWVPVRDPAHIRE